MIVNCVAYDRGQRLSDIALNEVRLHLDRRGCFVWVALKDPEASELASLQEEFGLHELAIEDAQKGHQRPKIEQYGETLFIALRTAQLGRDSRRIEMGETHLFVGPRFVVSVRHGASLSYAEVRARSEAAPTSSPRARASSSTPSPTSSSTGTSRWWRDWRSSSTSWRTTSSARP